MSIWEIDGRLVVNEDKAPIECDECPCNIVDLPCCSSCDDCTASTTPRTITITVTGIVDDSCGDCSDFNGTYVLEKDDDVDPCSWGLSFENDCFPGEQCDWILIPGGLGSPWELVLTISNNPDGGTWLSFGGGDCNDSDTASNFNSVGTECDFSSSSVDIVPDDTDICECGPACSCCTGATFPSVRVTFAGVSNDSGCTDCDDFNAEWELEGPCPWELTSGVPCDYTDIILEIQCEASHHYPYDIYYFWQLTVDGPSQSAAWLDDLGTTEPSCQDTPSFTDVPSEAGNECDFSSATVSVQWIEP